LPATVLVVQDERKLRELVRSYLERAGFTVLST
jgi:DNA-binding response OmpR family regulator